MNPGRIGYRFKFDNKFYPPKTVCDSDSSLDLLRVFVSLVFGVKYLRLLEHNTLARNTSL